MQLTKDEIDALLPKPYRASGQQMSYDGYDKAHCHLFSIGQVHSVVSAAIAAHTAKVLGDVEPVGEVILNYSTHMERCHPDGPMNDVAWLVDAAVPKSGTKLYPAHTVAALAARVAELEAALRTADHTFAENGILASHAARQEIQAALTKGQP